MDGQEDDPAAADVFAAIGNERRIAIVYELQRAFRDGDAALPYAELKRRVGLRDSGNFNYHLQQLVGRFVHEREDGYALTYAGRKVASALTAGIFTDRPDGESLSAPGTCYACGAASLAARYEHERVYVACDDCGEELLHGPFPPGPATRRDDLLDAFERWTRRWNDLAAAGTCPECGSRMTATVTEASPPKCTGDVSHRFRVACTECWARANLPPGCLVRDHPRVVDLLATRTTDAEARPLWDLDWALHRDYLDLVEEDPVRLRLRVPGDDAELHVTFDAEATVVETAVVER